MKVLQVINSLRFGGAEHLLTNLVTTLHEHGSSLDMEVCTLFEEGVWPEKLRESGISVRNLDVKKWDLGSVTVRLRKLITEGKYDIVHAHLWPTLYYVGLISRFLPKPTYIFTEHNTWNKRRGYRVLRVLESCAYKSYQFILANSRETKTSLTEWLPELESKVRIIENGVPVPPLRKKDYRLSNPISLLMVGRLVSQKGVDTALESVRILLEDSFKVKLTLVGDGPLRVRLQEQARGLPVEFDGFSSRPYEVMAKHDVLLMPSRWEGFGLTAIEAQMLGLPVIGSRIDALARIITHGKTGLLCAAEDPHDLASKARQLILEEGLRRRLAENARESAIDNWTIDRFAKDLIDFYKGPICGGANFASRKATPKLQHELGSKLLE